MLLLRAADYRRMPWKNGGGSTIEIAVSPPGATLDDFDWRISMAHVATPGPFSCFPGVERTIAVLNSAGMRLSIADAAPVVLDRTSQPHSFAGDVSASATLIDGPVDDLNIMSRRARYTHRMTRRQLSGAFVLPFETGMVAMLPRGGHVEVGFGTTSIAVADGDTIILEDQDIGRHPTHVRPVGTAHDTDLYVIELWRRDCA